MNLEFDSIEIEHFKSFASKQPLSLAKRGPSLTFIRGRNEVEPRLGSNGSGKSTLLGDALTWCLFGKTPAGLKNPDLKSWGSSKTPLVSLSIKLDGKPCTISRTAATNGLKIDGQEVGSEEAAKLLNLNFEVFTNTILLAQGQPLFFDRSPKDKMQLFTDVLNLERWEDRSTAASAKVRELEQLEAELKGELTGAEAALTQTEELLIKTQERSAEWVAERERQTKDLGVTLKEKRAALERQRAKLDVAELSWDSAATELKALRQKLPELNRKARDALSAFNNVVIRATQCQADIKRFELELEALDKAKECPTCGQPVKKANLKVHKDELLDKIEDYSVLLERFNLEPLKVAADVAEAVLGQANQDAAVFAEKEEKALTELSFLRPQVAEFQAQVTLLSNVHSTQNDQPNPYSEQVAELRRKKSQAEVNIRGLEEDLIKAARQIERTKFWVKGFKDVALFLIEEVLQELEITTNVMLTEVGLEDWRVSYSVEKETKSGTVTRGLNASIFSPRNKQAVRYENWSGGEGQRLRIVSALALSEVLLNHAGVCCNLEVLDEPTRHLSSQGVKDLCEYLSERAIRLEKSIFLVDHAAREGIQFSGVVTVVKTAQGSVIEA